MIEWSKTRQGSFVGTIKAQLNGQEYHLRVEVYMWLDMYFMTSSISSNRVPLCTQDSDVAKAKAVELYTAMLKDVLRETTEDYEKLKTNVAVYNAVLDVLV